MSSAPLIEFFNLRKEIDGRCLLNIPQLAMHAGRCIVLSGENGAGKTTLLKIIAGLEPPDRAQVAYGGSSEPWRSAQHRYRSLPT